MIKNLSNYSNSSRQVQGQNVLYVGNNRFVFAGLKQILGFISDDIVLSFYDAKAYAELEDKIDLFDVVIFDATQHHDLSTLIEDVMLKHDHVRFIIINNDVVKIQNPSKVLFISSMMNEKNIIAEFEKVFYLKPTNQGKERFSESYDVAKLFQKLSNREFEIARLMIKGYGNLEISNELNLKASTVSTFKSRIFQKLKIFNIIQLVNKFDEYHYIKCV